jgi:hypothetical protein
MRFSNATVRCLWGVVVGPVGVRQGKIQVVQLLLCLVVLLQARLHALVAGASQVMLQLLGSRLHLIFM